MSELLDALQRQWNKSLVMDTFEAIASKKILRIPLATIALNDLRVWFGESCDAFSVRSAYQILQQFPNDPIAYVIQTDSNSTYKKNWELNLPRLKL